MKLWHKLVGLIFGPPCAPNCWNVTEADPCNTLTRAIRVYNYTYATDNQACRVQPPLASRSRAHPVKFKIAVTTYRALNGSAPTYLSSYFTRVPDVPSRQRFRSASSNQLAVPPFNLSTVGKRTFPVSGANFWNSLPLHVTSAPSLAIFRQRLKTFLFHLSYPYLIFWFVSCFIVDPWATSFSWPAIMST